MQGGGLSKGALNTSSSFCGTRCIVKQQQECENPGCTAAVPVAAGRRWLARLQNKQQESLCCQSNLTLQKRRRAGALPGPCALQVAAM